MVDQRVLKLLIDEGWLGALCRVAMVVYTSTPRLRAHISSYGNTTSKY